MDENLLKEGGFIKQKQSEFFIARIKVLGGDLTSKQMRQLSQIADDYGQGWVHLSVRQGVEIPFIKIEDFEKLIKELEQVGLSMGACGPRVRVIVSCPGSSICSSGLRNTKELTEEIDKHIYGQGGLPHKFKVGITGCASACAKPQENDLGFMGIVEPVFDEVGGECIACGLCEETCLTGAISLDEEEKPIIDYTKCSFDGKCIKICPSYSIGEKNNGWRVYIGGKFGRYPQLGLPLVEFVDDNEAVEIAKRTLKAYKKLGNKKERLRETIDRLGLEEFKKEVLTFETLS